MKREEFCEVLGGIDERYVEEARAARRAGKPDWRKWGGLAACLCFVAAAAIAIVPSLLKPQGSDGVENGGQTSAPKLVSAPGFLKLTAYPASLGTESPSEEAVIMQEGIEVPVNSHWSPAMSSRPGIPFHLSAPEYPDTIFEVSVDGGELLLWEGNKITHVESPFRAENGATIYWTSLSRTDRGSFETYRENQAYINIVIREGENLVGFAVAEIYTDDSENGAERAYTYYAKLLKSVSFPKVHGSFQSITAEYVEAEMRQIRNGNTDSAQDV